MEQYSEVNEVRIYLIEGSDHMFENVELFEHSE